MDTNTPSESSAPGTTTARSTPGADDFKTRFTAEKRTWTDKTGKFAVEAIAKAVPGYEQLSEIGKTKEEFQIAGRTFHEPTFATPSSPL